VVRPLRLEHCRAEWVRAAGAPDDGPVILYFHGGAYVSCGLRTHRRLVARLSNAADARVLSVAYRMLPRHEIALSVLDGLDAYRTLLAGGMSPEHIVLAGDSAGGGLAVLVALAAINADMPRPAAIVALSPWIELDPAGKAEHPNARTDPMLPISGIKFMFEQLIARGEPLHPDLVPLERDLTKLPPVLIHSGTTEVLQHDAVLLADKLAAAGVPVELKHWRGQVHVFQIAADLLPEAREAIDEIGQFVRRHTAADANTAPAVVHAVDAA
jgi:acetyl esterase/lipase